MGAKRWGNALPQTGDKARSEVEELRALLVEKGVLTEEEVAQSKGKQRKA